MNLVWRIIGSVFAVWLILSIFLPFVLGYIVLPLILVQLIQIGVVAYAIWYVITGVKPA